MKFVNLLLSTIVFPFLSFSVAIAQQGYSISAKITDATHQPLPVTARVLSVKDSSLIKGFSFENGNLLIPEIAHEKVLLKLTVLSFSDTIMAIENRGQSVIDLGTIIMKEQNLLLGEVQITSQAPLIKHGKNGSVEIQVPGTLLASSSSVIELLERSPGLSMSEGRIMFIGKGEAILFLNGRPITQEQLSAIAVNQILKVEILANPSSKYDAEGKAVVNIITKVREQGVSSSLTQQYSYSDFAGGESNTLFDLNYMKKKISVAGNFGILSGNNREILYTTRTRPAAADYLSSALTTDWKRKYDNFSNLGFGVQYDMNQRTNFSLSYRGNADQLRGSQESENAIITLTDNNLYSSYIHKNENRKNHSVTLNYNHALDTAGSTIFFGSQYTRYETTINDLINEDNLVDSSNVIRLIKNNVNHRIAISSTQADYTKAFKGDKKLEAGIKFSYATTSSATDFLVSEAENEFQPDDELSSEFEYTEFLPAAYVNYNTTAGKDATLTLGVRGEWTHYRLNTTAGDQFINDSYLNFFPNVLLSKKISDQLKIRASYVSKISRPRYQALNPFVIYQDPFTTIEGNPNLKPEKINAFEVGANYGAFDLRAGFNYTRDPISGAALRGEKPNSYVLKGINLQKDYTWLASVSYALNLSWWNTTNTATVTYSKSMDNQYDFVFVKPKPQVYFYTSNTFNVKNLFKIQLLAWYLGEKDYGLYHNNSRATVTLGVEKAFLKNALTLRFTANDIFHQTNISGTYSVGQTDIYFNRTYSTNYFRVAATLRFGRSIKSRFNNKSTAESENSRAR